MNKIIAKRSQINALEVYIGILSKKYVKEVKEGVKEYSESSDEEVITAIVEKFNKVYMLNKHYESMKIEIKPVFELGAFWLIFDKLEDLKFELEL